MVLGYGIPVMVLSLKQKGKRIVDKSVEIKKHCGGEKVQKHTVAGDMEMLQMNEGLSAVRRLVGVSLSRTAGHVLPEPIPQV